MRFRRARLGLLVAVGAASALVAPVTAAQAARTTNILHTGSEMRPGRMLVSANGEYRFVMQTDGNLVFYRGSAALWTSETNGHPGADAFLQRDGNFVIYFDRRAIWESGTDRGGSAANFLCVQNDGNVVIYNGHTALWWTDRPPATLVYGDQGALVSKLQERLRALHYWVGPIDGVFGDSTEQAVWALQKAAGLDRSGIVGPATWEALERGVMPTPKPASGNLIEVNLSDDLLMIIQKGKLWATLNTSTGGGYTYVEDGVTSVATTPTGVFHIYYAINGPDVDPLGELWRPRFFVGGYAIHGDGNVPPYPASHGCVRVSNEAIDWIWAENLAPIGEEVWIY